MNRRTQFLQLALQLFDERGVRGASMRELARRAGVDVRSAYYHFESKRDLLRALFEEAGYLEPVDPKIHAALGAMTAEEALSAIVEGSLDMLQRRAAHSRLIHAEVLVGAEDAIAVGHELWARWGEQLEALVEAGGLVRPEETAAFARQLRSLLWGIFNESQLTGELAAPSRRKARAREVTAFLLPRRRPVRSAR